jgi:hypothetical protein
MPRDSGWYQRLAVHPSKIADYLMSQSHEDGRHKQRFLTAHGFTDSRPDVLIDALLRHAATAVEISDTSTSHGRKWVLRGRLQCPDGRQPIVQTVWFEDQGAPNVRLVTAYPVRREQR